MGGGRARWRLCWAGLKANKVNEIFFFSFQQSKANFQINFEFSFVFSKVHTLQNNMQQHECSIIFSTLIFDFKLIKKILLF
jgi:hypothetical protein